MIPYVLLIAIPAVFAFIAIDTSNTKSRILLGACNHPRICRNNLALPVFFVLFFLMLALRHETLGRDLDNYKFFFELYPEQPLEYFDLWRFESLYRLFNWGVGQITQNYQIFLILIAAISLLPVAKVYCEYRSHGYMQIAIFVCMSTFVIYFSALRQVISIALGMIAYEFVRKKQWVLFLLTAVVALGFHHSAFMIFFMYPLYYMRLKKNHLWFVVPILAGVFVFNRQIFQAMTLALTFFGEEYELDVSSTGAYTMLVLFLAFAAFSYIVADESQMDDELFGLRNFLLLAVLLQCFAPVHSLAMRMNYYYIIFIPITMARLIDVPRPNMKRLAKLASIMIALYFTYDFLYKTYQSCETGISALNTIPYRFMWMNG